MDLSKEFTFEVAHSLPEVASDHKCHMLHGHSFRVEVYVRGEVLPSGFVCDFSVISEAFAPLQDQLDHHFLNDIPDLSNPTSENLAIWIWDHLHKSLPLLLKVIVMETEGSKCIYFGDHNG